MNDYLVLIQKYGTELASGMIYKLTLEANSVTGTRNIYKHPEPFRDALFACAAKWKEAVILYEQVKLVENNIKREI